MGEKIVPREYGLDCAACWDPDETPLFVWVVFDGVLKGLVAGAEQVQNGHVYKLEQDPLNPCTYYYNWLGAGWKCQFFRSGATGRWHLSLYYNAFEHFVGNRAGCPAEHDVWSNLYTDPNVSRGYGGVGTVWWGEEVLDLIFALGIPDEEGTFYEVFLIGQTNFVYKFCNVKYALNQKIVIS
jgi:hypothetical protein